MQRWRKLKLDVMPLVQNAMVFMTLDVMASDFLLRAHLLLNIKWDLRQVAFYLCHRQCVVPGRMAFVHSTIHRNVLSATRVSSLPLVVSRVKSARLASISHPSVARCASTVHLVLLLKELARVRSRHVPRVMPANFLLWKDAKIVLRAGSQRGSVASLVRLALRGSLALQLVVQVAWFALIARLACTRRRGVIDAHRGITSWKQNALSTETGISTRVLKKHERNASPGVQDALASGTGDATMVVQAATSSFARLHMRGVASSLLVPVEIRHLGLRDACF